MWVIGPILFVLALAAVIAQWAVPKYNPSFLARFPGGLAEFRRRYTMLSLGCVAAGLLMSALTSGNLELAKIALGLMYGAPLVALGFLILRSLLRKSRMRRARAMRFASASAEPERASAEFQQKQVIERQTRWQQQLQRLAYPYDLVPGDQAEAAYEAARAKGQVEGYTPLIITPDTWLFPDFTRQRLISRAQRVLDAAPDAQVFFAERQADVFPDNADGATRQRMLAEAEAFAGAAPIGATPTIDNRMCTLQDMRGTQPPFSWVEQAALVRIPTPQSWEIPAYTLYGGWNACPGPASMVAVARYWNERYGADVCALGNGTFEFRVARPPVDQREALALLRQHLLFCDEGMDDLISTPAVFRDAVARLLRQKYWLFWWD